MKTSKLIIRLIALAAFSSAIASSNAAFAAPVADQVPFHGNLEGTQTFSGFGIPPAESGFPPVYLPLITSNEMGGNFLHMGRVAATYTFWFLPISPTAGYTFVVGTLTAANGDTVGIAGLGLSQPGGPGRVNDGGFVVTGGTGRFTGATGGGTYHGEQVGVLAVPGNTAPVELLFNGTISNPNGG